MTTDDKQGDLPIADPEAMKVLARELIAGWSRDDGSGRAEFGQRNRRPDKGRFLAIHGLTAHCHHIARSALDLIDDGRQLEAMPLIRFAFECSITAMWLAQNEDAGRAIANEYDRQRRVSARSLTRADNPALQAAAANFPDLDVEPLQSSSDAQARSFEQRCRDLKGGSDLYVYYRLMCDYAHPTARLVEEYLVSNEAGDDATAILTTSRMEVSAMWLFFLTASLIWSVSAMDYIDPTRRRRSELRAAAKALGTTRDLHLTDEAARRIDAR